MMLLVSRLRQPGSTITDGVDCLESRDILVQEILHEPFPNIFQGDVDGSESPGDVLLKMLLCIPSVQHGSHWW